MEYSRFRELAKRYMQRVFRALPPVAPAMIAVLDKEPREDTEFIPDVPKDILASYHAGRGYMEYDSETGEPLDPEVDVYKSANFLKAWIYPAAPQKLGGGE